MIVIHMDIVDLTNRASQILEDYDKQLQTLKSQVETIKKDYEEWEKERNPTGEDKN